MGYGVCPSVWRATSNQYGFKCQIVSSRSLIPISHHYIKIMLNSQPVFFLIGGSMPLLVKAIGDIVKLSKIMIIALLPWSMRKNRYGLKIITRLGLHRC